MYKSPLFSKTIPPPPFPFPYPIPPFLPPSLPLPLTLYGFRLSHLEDKDVIKLPNKFVFFFFSYILFYPICI